MSDEPQVPNRDDMPARSTIATVVLWTFALAGLGAGTYLIVTKSGQRAVSSEVSSENEDERNAVLPKVDPRTVPGQVPKQLPPPTAGGVRPPKVDAQFGPKTDG